MQNVDSLIDLSPEVLLCSQRRQPLLNAVGKTLHIDAAFLSLAGEMKNRLVVRRELGGKRAKRLQLVFQGDRLLTQLLQVALRTPFMGRGVAGSLRRRW